MFAAISKGADVRSRSFSGKVLAHFMMGEFS